MKFGRLYSMTVEGQSEDANGDTTTHLIQFPLTCRFRITKTNNLSSGSATFQIYNLSQDVRSDIYMDMFDYFNYKQVTFSAGYEGEQLPILFQGNIWQAYSYRRGPDWITEIQVHDGGFARENGEISLTKPAPYSLQDLAKDVIGAMPQATLGTIGKLDINRPPPFRGITLTGNAWDLLARAVLPIGGVAFIENEEVNIVQQWEYINNIGGLETINTDTGILGSPRLQDNLVTVSMLFEPRIIVQQKLQLKNLEPRMDGDYIVQGLSHSGTISGAVCESFTTELGLYNPNRSMEAA